MGLEIIGVVVYSILKDWLPKKYGNHIEQAWVWAWNGEGYENAVKGRLVDTETGYEYIYRIHGTDHSVTLDDSYPVEYYKTKRMIFAEIGTSNPRNLPGHPPIPFLASEIAKKMNRDAAVAVYKSLKKKTAISMQMIIMALVVIAVIVAAVIIIPKLTKKKVPATTNPITTTQPATITTTPYILPGGK
jgi:hypothetical protein